MEGSNGIIGAEAAALLPYYVYELRDPRNGAAFYVGKGKGQRVWQHTEAEESAKGRTIDAIKSAGHQDAIRVVIGRFETEEEAFAVESTLIKWVYGFSKLANRVHGHRHAFIRAGEEKYAPAFSLLPSVDVPRVLHLHDGSYTKNQKEQIARHGIVEKLEAIRMELLERPELGGLNIGEPDISRPQDPILTISGFSSCMDMTLKLQLTGKTVVIGINPKGRQHVAAFDRAIREIAVPFDKKNGAANGYARIHDYKTRMGGFPKGIPIDRTDIMADHIGKALARLADRGLTNEAKAAA